MPIKKLWRYKDKNKSLNIVITIIGSLIYTIGITTFLMPMQLYTGGFTGVAQIIIDFVARVLGKSAEELPLGVGPIWLLLNVPTFILGFKVVGRRFTFLSIVSVLSGSIFLELLPPINLGSTPNDMMLYSILGGVVTGIGVGITLRVGSSTGGMDIVSQYLSLEHDRSVGQYSFILNTMIVIVAGLLNENWTIALYTIVNLFISTIVIDKVYTRHHKFTLLIITEKSEELVSAIHSRITRGITILPATGAYSKTEKNVLIMVITSSELYNTKAIIEEVDPYAFTDVLKSQYIYGNFIKTRIE